MCSQVRDLHGEEDRRAGVRAAGGSGGGQAQDGDDGVRLPHGSRNETNLEAQEFTPAFIFHSCFNVVAQLLGSHHHADIMKTTESSTEDIKKHFLTLR